MFKSFINHNKQQSKKSIKNLHDDPRTNVFHITDEFFCSGCYATIEKEKINSKTNNTFINNEEEIDYWNIDYNPDMEEETKCLYCFKSSYPASATCLIEGKNIFNIFLLIK